MVTFGSFLLSKPGEGVRTAFKRTPEKKKKKKKKTTKRIGSPKGPLAESPGNILLDRPPRDLFRR